MSPPCWSLSHLVSSSPPQHEAPPGQHDLLQDDTVHRAHLQKPFRSTRSARTSITRMAETRATPLPQGMSPRSLRPKSLRQYLEVLWKASINYTMYREFGEQDQQAPIIEEVKEFGQLGTKLTRSRDGRDVTC